MDESKLDQVIARMRSNAIADLERAEYDHTHARDIRTRIDALNAGVQLRPLALR
jgi:hypothetical protein